VQVRFQGEGKVEVLALHHPHLDDTPAPADDKKTGPHILVGLQNPRPNPMPLVVCHLAVPATEATCDDNKIMVH